MSQAWLASYKASDSYQWRFLIDLLKPITSSRWIKRPQVTALEFGFILSGYEPIPDQFLSKVVEELQTTLYHIKPASFRNMYSSEGFIKSVRERFPGIKGEAEVIEKILQQAQALLDCLEIINRGMIAMPREYQACFSIEQGTFKEKLWRFEFLIYWAKHEVNIQVPHELIQLDESFELQKELDSKTKNELRQAFGKDQIMVDGLIDVRKIMSTKLVLALENYVLNMYGKEINQIPSSSAVEAELVDKYGDDGVTETIARSINECSRHDAKAKVPLSNARKKTIFFQ